MRWIVFAPLALAACGNAAKIESAKPGSTVKLSGAQGVVSLSGKSWSPAITVDASNATFTGIVLDQVKGIRFRGGTVVGPGGKSYGIRVLMSQNVSIEGMTITGAHRGVVIDRSQDIAVRDTQLTGLISDGIDIASSQRIRIERNSCAKFAPTLATFDAQGVKHDGDHPDCIQAWSKIGEPNTADVSVIGNRADGIMQGVFFGDHDVGGFDRIEIRDNVLRTGLSNAIAVGNARGLILRNNRVSSVPGAKQIRNGAQVKASINVRGETNATVCGNTIADVPKSPANQPC